MEFGPPAAGSEVEAKIEELRAAVYSLAEIIQRQAGGGGAGIPPGKLDKLDKLDKIDDLIRVLEILARQSDESTAAMKNLAPSLAKMQQVFEVNQKQIAELGTKIEGMRDSIAWASRQSGDMTTLTKQMGERLQAMPTSEQLSTVAKRVENIAGKEDFASLNAKLDKVVESYGWMAREMHASSEAVQELSNKVEAVGTLPAKIESQVSQGIAVLSKTAEQMPAKLEAQFSQGANTMKALGVDLKNELHLSQADLARNIAEVSKKVDATVGIPAKIDERLAGVDKKLSDSAARFDSRMNENIEASKAAVREVSAELKQSTEEAMKELKASTDAAVKDLAARVANLPTSDQLAQAFSQTGKRLEGLDAKMEDVAKTSEEVAENVADSVKAADEALFNIREAMNKAGEQTMLMNDAMASMAAKIEDGLKGVSANLNAVTSQADAVRKQNETLVDALSAVQQGLSRNITVLESLPSKIQAGVTSSTTALDGRIGALQENISKLGEASSKSSDAVAKALAEASARTDSLAAAFDKKTGELNAKSSDLGARMSKLAESLENAQSLQKNANSDLGGKIEEVKSTSAMLAKESAYTAASIREMVASLGAQRKQGDVQIESLIALSKKLDSTMASLKAATEHMEDVTGKGVDKDRFENVASQVNALSNAASALVKSSEASSARSEQSLASLQEEFEKARKQNDLVVELLSTLTRETADAKKAAQDVKARLESGAIEAEIEKRFLTRLSERLTPK